eukprot:TRINITY_DN34137_c0_g1_i1.p1 TRINITY_DN34137_c0_g1~~TRINITY_DN34137_c0_g1_i1.p1  ORF type:complete len:786 (-),score=148.73 TRINITY_DN34137_c0_g1_i1:50-2407(-)
MSKVFRSFAKTFHQNQREDSDDDEGPKPPSRSGSMNPRRAFSFGRKKVNIDSYEASVVPNAGKDDEIGSGNGDAAPPVLKRRTDKKASLVSNALSAVLGRRRAVEQGAPKPSPSISSSSAHPGEQPSAPQQADGQMAESRPVSTLPQDMPELTEAERARFVSQVNRTKAQNLKAYEDTLSKSCSLEDIHSYRDNLLGEAWTVICQGYLTKEYTRYVDAENRHKRFLKENREVQTAYLRELTALRDQLRTLPEGSGRFLDVSHFEVLRCLDPDLRPLVEAAVQERMKTFLGQSHAQDSELSMIVSKHLAEERSQYVTERDEAVAKAEKLQKQVAALESDSAKTESILDRERKDAKELKESFAECENERNSLKLELDRFVADVEQLKTLQENDQRALKAKEQEIQELEVQLKASLAARMQSSISKSSDSKPASRCTTPSTAPGRSTSSSSSLPANLVSGQLLGLPEAAAETLEVLSGLQDQLCTTPQTALELHRVLEVLGERLDSDCLEAAYKCKPRATAASIELLAHRVRTARKECALARQCCVAMADAVLAASQMDGELDQGRLREGADQALATHKNLLLQSSSVYSQNVSFLEEPRQRAIQAAAVVLGDAGPPPVVSKSKPAHSDNNGPNRSKTPQRGKTEQTGLPSIKSSADERIGDAESTRPSSQETADKSKTPRIDAEELCVSPHMSRRVSSSTGRTVTASKRAITQPFPAMEMELEEDAMQVSLPAAVPAVSKSSQRKANAQLRNSPTPPPEPRQKPDLLQASPPGGGAFVIPRRRNNMS